MPALFQPRLVNGPFEDPGLFIPLQFERRAILFDLGDLSRLPPRDLLKISHVFVTHTHMDHFIGFDQLLRCILGREKDLFLYGPIGFIGNVEGTLCCRRAAVTSAAGSACSRPLKACATMGSQAAKPSPQE
jgi:ribonuclease Z